MIVTPTFFRSLGGVLQIAGVVLVVVELQHVRRRYPNAPEALATKLAKRARRLLPRRKVRTVIGGTMAVEVDSSASARGRVIPGWDEDAPVESKIQTLLRSADLLRGEVDQVNRRVDEEAKTRAEQNAAMAAELDRETSRLDAELEQAQTGHLRIRGWGVGFLVLGIAFATWAQEFAQWTGWKAPH